MRNLCSLLAASLLFLSPALVIPLRGQQQPRSRAPPSVQVGVPEGRGGGGAGQQGDGQGRGREAGPPKPTPRNASGHVLIGGGRRTTRVCGSRRGVAPNPLGLKDVPFQPWAKAVLTDRETNELEPHTRCKPSGVPRQFLTPYGVEFVELPDLQRIFIFDIGGPHTYRTIYMDGRAHPESSDADLLRPLHRLVGRRHAGRRHRRLQRRLLDGPRAAAAHRAAAHAREVHAHRLRHAATTS